MPIGESPYQAPSPNPRAAEILVESDPPGARIEMNDGYEGTAPLRLKVPVKADGRWADTAKITASPVVAGQQVQLKLFFPGQSVPKRIFFDMNLVRSRPSIDVNIDSSDDEF